MLSKSTRPQGSAWQTTLRIPAAVAVLLAAAGCSGPPEQDGQPKVTRPPVESTTASPVPNAQPGGPMSSPAPSAPVSKDSVDKAFPKDLIPPMDDAQILVSDIEASQNAVSISFVASTKASPERILKFYGQALTDHQFEPLESNSVKGAASRTYTRKQGAETVNISVVESGSTSTITIGAHLSPKSVDSR